MENNSGDKVNVLEAAEALLSGDVPQPDSLVHGRAKHKVVLGPRDVQQIRGVTLVRGKRLGHKGTHAVVRHCVRLLRSGRLQRLLGRRGGALLVAVLGAHVREVGQRLAQHPHPQHPVLASRSQ